MTPIGEIIDHTINSMALIKPMRIRVYLPPGYDKHSKYPTVYLLHPWGPDERYWTDSLGVHEAADRLINGRAVPPFVALMPQGDKSFWINAEDPGGDFSLMQRLDPEFFTGALEGYGDYADYILRDVIGFAERTYALQTDRRGRMIAGISMGGAGAAVLAFRNPTVFGGVGIHSPAIYSDAYAAPPWIYGLGDEEAFRKRDPVHLAARFPAEPPLRIYIDCGTEDDLSHPTAALSGALRGRGIEHVYRSRPGGHRWDYWKQHLAEYLGFYAGGW